MISAEEARATGITPDYEGWTLDQETYARCPDDCGQRSPETDDLAELTAWIDGHKCNGWRDLAAAETP